MTLGEALRTLRDRLGLTQDGLAHRLGVTHETISHRETGYTGMPTARIEDVSRETGHGIVVTPTGWFLVEPERLYLVEREPRAEDDPGQYREQLRAERYQAETRDRAAQLILTGNELLTEGAVEEMDEAHEAREQAVFNDQLGEALRHPAVRGLLAAGIAEALAERDAALGDELREALTGGER